LFELADAADLKVSRPRGITGPVEIRYEREYIFQMLLPRLPESRGIEYRHAGRNILRGCRSERTGDDDFVKRWLGLGGCRESLV
jgi:hypothetical protein